MKQSKLKRTLVYLMVSLVLGAITTHYLEEVQTSLLVSVRNKVVYGEGSAVLHDQDEVIPKVRYSFTDEPQINPVSVAQSVKRQADYVLDLHEAGKEGFLEQLDANELLRVVQVADFLIGYAEKNQNNNLSYWLYPYRFNYPSYDEVLTPPWYSGMAQGQVIETLLAAFVITRDESYLSAAQLSANAFYIPVDDGGVTIFSADQGAWFEEYAKQNTTHPQVLNGHNFALLGLERLLHFDCSYSDIYDQGILALESFLPRFDVGVWSRYDLLKYMANPKYHRIHIEQLNKLGRDNNNDVLMKYARKFTMQKVVPIGAIYRLIFYPHNSLVIVFSLNTLFFLVACLVVGFIRTQIMENYGKG